MRIQRHIIKTLLPLAVTALIGVLIGCQPESTSVEPQTRQVVSQLASPTPEMESPLATPTPSATPICDAPWPTPPALACPWLPTPTPQSTSAIPTRTPWIPPTQPAQTPTPLPLPTVPTSPAGKVFFTALYAPGTTPSEPKAFYASFDEQGQLAGPITSWTPSAGNMDILAVIGRLSVSPNGKYLASIYESVAETIDFVSGKLVAFTGGGEFLSWHPNGYEFLFRQYESLDPGLWLVDARTGQHRLLAQPSDLNITGAAVSPDGQVLAYSINGPGIYQIWLANADGSEPRLVSNSGFVYGWSPDGHSLLYSGEPAPAVGKGTPIPYTGGPLWLMDRDGQNRRPLNLPWPMLAGKPVWSPTGRYVAGVSQINNPPTCHTTKGSRPDPLCLLKDAGIYVKDLETGQVRIVARQAADPAWSPDGSLLAIARMDEKGQVDIWVISLDGHDQQRVTNTPEFDRYPVWIPQ